jgi:hypothetical protein
MPTIKTYAQFGGLHYETGPVRDVLAHLGVLAPHTSQPLSEAMLMGISGGAVFGYFLFAYKGFDPMLSLISRNTFDPLETLLTRLALPREVKQTTDAKKAEANLIEALESNQPAIVWADLFSLPYNAITYDEAWWAMQPLVVYGYEKDTVHIADRSHAPLTASRADFNKARARIKKDKFRLMTLAAPNLTKLKDAVQKGIWQCVQLYTEKPPKGAKTNFGFEAYRHWANMLTNTRNTQSWERFFPAGFALWSALVGHGLNPGLVGWVHTWGFGDGFERGAYADFLDEAAALLKRPKLKTAASFFRESRGAWLELTCAAMPDDVPLCREARELIIKRHSLFVQQGNASIGERLAISKRLGEIRAAAAQSFPFSSSQVVAIRKQMSDLVMKIHDLEFEGVKAMQSAMN